LPRTAVHSCHLLAFILLFLDVRLFQGRMKCGLIVTGLLISVLPIRAERINHEGRILGALPVVTNSILFNSANADAVVSAMQVFPVTNPWNEDISRRPVLANSDAMIAQITADLSATRRSLRIFKEMNFVLVPDFQPTVPIQFVDYPDESDLDGGLFPTGLYPISTNMPIEKWPSETGGLTLQQWQQDMNNDGGDRHAIVVQPGSGYIREMWQAKRVGASWESSNGAKFNLNTNGLRPAGWTSGDAAGLPMFPALPRFDECERGMVEHAMRIVVAKSRKEYIYPATHFASCTSATQTNVPAMGQRVRLKSSFTIPSTWTQQEKAVLLALKKFGALVADNGGFFSISVTPDDRWPAGCFDHLTSIGITNSRPPDRMKVRARRVRPPRTPERIKACSPVCQCNCKASSVLPTLSPQRTSGSYIPARPTSPWPMPYKRTRRRPLTHRVFTH
jgi:hypothetical protein